MGDTNQQLTQWHRCQRGVGGSVPQHQGPWLVDLSGRQEAGPHSFSSRRRPVGAGRLYHNLNQSARRRIMSNRCGVHDGLRSTRTIRHRTASTLGHIRWGEGLVGTIHRAGHPGGSICARCRVRRSLKASIRNILRVAVLGTHCSRHRGCDGCVDSHGPGRRGRLIWNSWEDVGRWPAGRPGQGRDRASHRFGRVASGQSCAVTSKTPYQLPLTPILYRPVFPCYWESTHSTITSEPPCLRAGSSS